MTRQCTRRVFGRGGRLCRHRATARVIVSNIFGGADLGPFCTLHARSVAADGARLHRMDCYAVAFVDCRACDGEGVTEGPEGSGPGIACRTCADRLELLEPMPV